MSLKEILLCCLFFGVCRSGISENQMLGNKFSPEDYIVLYQKGAVSEMSQHGIPASITLGQAMLESDFGNSELAVYANNHFGIKCKKDWEGLTYGMNDDEENECFRHYEHALDSYADHSIFLVTRPRYAFLFDLSQTDYRAWASGLKAAGYATHPEYTEKLIAIIEQYRLDELDKYGSFLINPFAVKKPVSGDNLLHPLQEITGISRKPMMHEVMILNKTDYIILRKGDTFAKIAREFRKSQKELVAYNDYNHKSKLKEGEKLFIVRKRRKSTEFYHIVKVGEDLKSISDMHAMGLKYLVRRNRLHKNSKIRPGLVLYLNKRKPIGKTMK